MVSQLSWVVSGMVKICGESGVVRSSAEQSRADPSRSKK